MSYVHAVACGATERDIMRTRLVLNTTLWLFSCFLFITSANAWGQCAPPTYDCARTDTSVVNLPSILPNWGGLTGSGAIFTDSSFNSIAPPKYVRVTDANTYLNCHPALGPNGVYEVTDGSGDEQVFNSN